MLIRSVLSNKDPAHRRTDIDRVYGEENDALYVNYPDSETELYLITVLRSYPEGNRHYLDIVSILWIMKLKCVTRI